MKYLPLEIAGVSTLNDLGGYIYRKRQAATVVVGHLLIFEDCCCLLASKSRYVEFVRDQLAFR